MATEHGIVHKRSQGLIDYAYRFAKDAHKGQKRKYTDEPYITHPVAVAKMVSEITTDCNMVCAALLHDTIEDTDITYTDIFRSFGKDIADMVLDLTDISKPEDGNRRARKALDRMHTAAASKQAKTIKLADLIHNSESILARDPDFAKIYIKEKEALLPYLADGSYELFNKANRIVKDYKEKVNEK